MRTFAALALACWTAVAAGCRAGGAGPERAGPSVVTTVSPIPNIVHNVVGEAASITGLVPEGVNSHTFEPAPSDARALSEADIVFANGLHLEEPTLRLAEANVNDRAKIVELGSRTIEPDDYVYDFSFPRAGGAPNPHLWTNPPYARRFAAIVANEMAALDPSNAGAYRRNYRHFARRLDALDDAVERSSATVPPADRRLLTYHDSFPYFAREYGWQVVGAVQPSDFSEPTPREVADLIDQVREQDVAAIFGSEVFPSPVLEQIAAEADARYVDDLRDDDLPGDPGDPRHSYIGLMIFDVETIVGALGGDPAALEDVPYENLVDDDGVEYGE